jgi:hypothetical protein
VCRKCINHIHPFYSLFTVSHAMRFSLTWLVLHSCPSLFKCLFHYSVWLSLPYYFTCKYISDHHPSRTLGTQKPMHVTCWTRSCVYMVAFCFRKSAFLVPRAQVSGEQFVLTLWTLMGTTCHE